MLLKVPTLITLQIFYYRPDYRHLLNEFVIQLNDYNPDYPRTHKFLLYWKDNIGATIKEILFLDNRLSQKHQKEYQYGNDPKPYPDIRHIDECS